MSSTAFIDIQDTTLHDPDVGFAEGEVYSFVYRNGEYFPSGDSGQLLPIKNEIQNLRKRSDWHDTEEISNACRTETLKVLSVLFNTYQLIPKRVAPSVEGGINLFYQNEKGRELILEIDNDSEVLGLVNSANEILGSDIILNDSFSKIINLFSS